MARTCEVWVKGTAENAGPVAVDQVYKTGWLETKALPVATTITGTGSAWSFWADQYGGNFFGAGWRSTPVAYFKNCTGTADLTPNQPYDCVNGGCVPKSAYNTPGVFGSLAACQSGCAKNSNCTGECVSVEEIAALQQAANKLQSRLCK